MLEFTKSHVFKPRSLQICSAPLAIGVPSDPGYHTYSAPLAIGVPSGPGYHTYSAPLAIGGSIRTTSAVQPND